MNYKNIFQKTKIKHGFLPGIVTNMRHFEALSHAHKSIERVNVGLDNRITGDFLAQDIRQCLYYLGEISGAISNDEILGHIFKNFCIGK